MIRWFKIRCRGAVAARALLLAAAVGLSAVAGPGDPAAVPSVTWTENLSGALARAGNELRPILLVFSAPDCPWCQRMKTETLAEKDVLAALEGFICVGIDTSRDEQAAREFQVRGVPLTMILSGDGRPLALAEGFMDKTAFLSFLDGYRKGGGKGSAAPPALDTWLKALQAGEVTATLWPDMMTGLGIKECRARLHQAMIGYASAPRRDWVDLLRHSHLSVRLGALEILEELAGQTFGYDPWFDPDANRVALERWRDWAAGGTNETRQVFAPLTEEQIVGYIRDMASGDRDRSARAVRMLEQAGASVIPVLESWSASGAAAGEDALRRVREVRYFLLLPDSLGSERARIVHRLVFGNQDERLRSLAATAAAGARALPVLADFLADADPLIREAAVDSLITAGKNDALRYLSDLLKNEKDEEVIHAVVRGAGRLKGAKAVELAAPFLSHAKEDLVVAALASLARTKAGSAANAVKECLKSPHWRVRAAALETIGKMSASSAEQEVIACLDDPDPFVRRTAVLTLSSLSAKKSASRLSELFLKDDPLKGPIVSVLRHMDLPIPATFGPALKGKGPEVLLAVLEGLGDGGAGSWRLALPYVRHENSDVACAAIRVVVRGGGREAEIQAELAKVLREGVKERVQAVFELYPSDEDRYDDSGSIDAVDSEEFERLVGAMPAAGSGGGVVDALAMLFSAFSAAPAPVPVPAVTPVATNAATEQVSLNDVFSAFGTAAPAAGVAAPAAPAAGPPGGAAGVNQAEERGGMVREALAYLDPKRDPELRLAAATMLLALGNSAGMSFLVESLESRTAEERLTIARRARRCRGDTTLPLIKKLLRDPSADVRQAGVSLCLAGSAGDALTRELIEAVFDPGAVLTPPDLFEESYQWYQALRRPSLRRKIGASVRQVLQDTTAKRHGDPHRILALTLLEACWLDGDQAIVAPYLAAENPFVRRSAWYAAGRHQPAEFLTNVQSVARDTSEWVRAVIPAVYGREGAVPWTVYFDAETAASGLESFSSTSDSRKRLAKPVVEVLTELSHDPALPVSSAAAMCLFSNREKTDLRALTAMLEAAPERQSSAYRLSSLLQEMSVSGLRAMNQDDLLALLDAVIAKMDDDDDSRLSALRKQLAAGSASTNEPLPVVLRKQAPKQNATAAPAQGTVGAAQRLVVFFRNPGCRDCERVDALLRALRTEFQDLSVEVFDIRKTDDARLNEALCDRFEVPDKYRLVAPAIFCGAGHLIKGDITFERLGRMLSRTEATATDWRQVSGEALTHANQALGERYSTMSLGIVFGAGLLDGINPCAFATIIFLLSYLQVARRTPREILSVGGAFVAGIFLAYFLLGLGLVEIVARLSLLRRLGLVLNWGLAAFVAVVALLSVWDGVQCLRGRMGAMVLQLPGVLKERIHGAVRHSTRHRHFVAAAFVAGAAIAVLELACTGQVYVPTMLYMLNTGQGRMGAVAYLALYNAAFIAPLLVVFAGAYGGLRSERLTQWLQQHAALVKFATAILFAVLFVLLVRR